MISPIATVSSKEDSKPVAEPEEAVPFEVDQSRFDQGYVTDYDSDEEDEELLPPIGRRARKKHAKTTRDEPPRECHGTQD